jgi:hypothetical protein
MTSIILRMDFPHASDSAFDHGCWGIGPNPPVIGNKRPSA